jgi:hypothetical protein
LNVDVDSVLLGFVASCHALGRLLENTGKIWRAASWSAAGTQLLRGVKARESHAVGAAAEAVTGFKRRRITDLARDYMMRHHMSDCPCRFDVVSIHLDSGAPVVEIFQNAFDA